MSNQRIVGIVLLVTGIVCILVGVNASHSISDQISNTFTGRFTEHTMLFIIGGAAMGILGLLLASDRIFGTKPQS